MPHVVPVYAALLALLFFALAIRTIALRGRYRVALGDGDEPLLRRAMRAHANFAEYVPLCLILLLSLEIRGADARVLHSLCMALLAGRCLHAIAFTREVEPPKVRQVAMALTFGAMLAAAALLISP